MGCPYWKEVVMVYCDALPVRKLIPADKVVQQGPCACDQYEHCPIFAEARKRLQQASEEPPAGEASDPQAGRR